MTGVITQDEKNLICFYYDGLCNDTGRLSRLYTEKSVLTISYENGSTTTYTENFVTQFKHNTGKPCHKVLISNMVSQNLEDDMLSLSILGQFVFADKSQKRFSHSFVVKRNDGFFFIISETIVFLNEEIIYEKNDNTCSISINRKDTTIKDIVDVLESFGSVEGIEVKSDSFVCKMGHLDIEFEDLLKGVQEKGLKVNSA